MRKRWILWTAAVLIAVCGIVGIQVGAYTASHMEWKRLYSMGDVSQVEDLRITMDDAPRNEQIRWITTWKPGGEAVTKHRVEERPIIRKAEEEKGSRAFLDVPMDCYTSGDDLVSSFTNEPDYERMDESWYPFLQPILGDLADRVKPGCWEECDYRIREFTKDIRGEFYCDWNTNYHLIGDGQIWKALQEQSGKIRFQVPEDAIMSVRMYKDERGKVTDLEYNCHPEGSMESYNLSCEGVLTPYGIYLMIESVSGFLPEQGKGLYKIPYSYTDEDGFRCQAPVIVSEFEDSTLGIRFASSADGEWMYLISQKSGKTWLTVYDTREGNPQQTILLSNQMEEYADWIRMDEDTQVLTFDSGNFISLHCEDGEWVKVGSADLYGAIRSMDCAINDIDADYVVYDTSTLDAAVSDDRTAIGYHLAGGALAGVCVFRGDELIYQEIFETDVWREYAFWSKANVEWEEQ